MKTNQILTYIISFMLIWLSSTVHAFISPDPYGHEGSLDLYSYANNDPVNYCDPDGRFGKAAFHGAVKGDYYTPSNTAQSVGKFIGQVAVGFVPGVGQAADARDFTAALNTGRTEGWNLKTGVGVVLAGVAFVPGVGDLAKAGGKKLLHAIPSSSVADATAKVGNRAPDFIVTPGGSAFPVPTGATGPLPTRAPGFQFVGGAGGKNLDSKVTGVRFMEPNIHQDARAIYMNQSGQTVNPFTGKTVSRDDPTAHFYIKE